MAHHEPVHHDFDRVALVLVQLPRLGQVHQLAVHPYAGETLAADLVKDPVTLCLAVLYDWTQDQQPRSFRKVVDLVHDLLDALALDLAAARWAVRMADSGEKQA